ncbi:MAG: thioesterase family protein [Ilumatobacteraceae bacterium]|nr:thioesterase family protein [Actinomycetota bacterium]
MVDHPAPDGHYFDMESAATGDIFRPTAHARGPWDAESCHAGPPTGLLARAVEHLLPDMRLARITVELTRPVPMAGFTIAAEITRHGRSVATATARIIDTDDRVVVTANSSHLRADGPFDLPTPNVPHPDIDATVADQFPLTASRHGLDAFMGSTAVRTPVDTGHGRDADGRATMWMRTVPLLATEEPSPFQAICPLADCGNAIGRNAEPTEVAFMNTDLSIHLHRAPVGAWFASRALSHWNADGIGMSDAELFDAAGPVGRAVQTLLIRPAG